jgi:uncharacterized protein (TIGR02646 family)
MIKVERTSKPNILSNHEERWKNQYLNAIDEHENQPDAKSKKNKDAAEKRYNHKEVKSALNKMFAGKCAYCESQILHIDYGDIEHFYPKSQYSVKCFDWDNLLLACGKCNGKSYKGDKFPLSDEGTPLLVNPVNDDPDVYFTFEFDIDTGTANVISLNERGEVTESTLGLNRTELVLHRSGIVRLMVGCALNAVNGDETAIQLIHELCKKEKEYSAFARSLVKRFNL